MEGGLIMEQRFDTIATLWPSIKDVFSVPHSEEEYLNLVSFLDSLIDEIGDNEQHPLASLMEAIGNLIETYETQTLPPSRGTPQDALKYLMIEHGLRQSDLPEIGSQGVVSELLKGKRAFNLRQVKALSERFHVSPLVFIQEQEDICE